MSKDKKYGLEQIKFVEAILPIFGITGFKDYNTKVVNKDITQDKIDVLNKGMDDFKRFFPTKNFNLARKNFKIDSSSLALSFLKNCLSHIGHNFECSRDRGVPYMRLKPFNKLLQEYIIQKEMSDIVHSATVHNQKEANQTQIIASNDRYSLIKGALREKLSSYGKWINLQLLLHTPVKKIILKSVPSNYTYRLYCCGVHICDSQLIEGFQTFDFSAYKDNSMVEIWQKVCEGYASKFMTDKEKKSSIDFSRVDSAYIDVVNNDPYDTFHIYNPKTKKFMDDKYIFEIHGITVSKGGVKKVYKEDYVCYPNRTFNIATSFVTECIEISEPVNSTLLLEKFSLTSDNGRFCFRVKGDKNRYHFEGAINQRIAELFPELAQKVNSTTVNTARIPNIHIVLNEDVDLDNLWITHKYYAVHQHNPETDKMEPVFV